MSKHVFSIRVVDDLYGQGVKDSVLGESPEGSQVEEEETGCEGSCVGGWDHVAGSRVSPCGQNWFGASECLKAPAGVGCIQGVRSGGWGKQRGEAEGFQGADWNGEMMVSP